MPITYQKGATPSERLEAQTIKSADKPFELKEALAAIENASPLPWSAVVGRPKPQRLDILDANGKLVCHFHVLNPPREASINYENDTSFIVNMTNIVATLRKELEELRKQLPQ